MQWLEFAVIILSVISVFSLVLAIWGLAALAGLRRRFRRWKDIHQTADLEAVYERTVEKAERLEKELAALRQTLTDLQEAVARKISTARIVRYNAFEGQGSDLSFSIALLDDHLDGVVISSIYGREESRMYAKPVVGGESRYALTEEERDVIEQSAHPGDIHRRVPV
ncbi:DUF4446 family protein [Alicyclobacillus cellulosilyticus]|nr:DUF4446 family protein [Alicyclobacillus cellulosilyticus]